MNEEYDVIVAGGGLAGLTFARHLMLEMPHLRMVVVEKQERPLPRAAHKVGESTLGPQGRYYAETLKLRDYLESQQVEKFGVRYFFSDVGQSFSERPELGGDKHYGIREYQVDRGKLENDLREMNINDGVTLLEGYVVRSMDSDDDGHTILCESNGEGEDTTLRGRWLIDASGRRRLVHRSGGRQELGKCSAAWWRIDGWVDVEDFVSDDETQWKSRVSKDHPRASRFGRVNSTIHLCGPGYWVWLIPLPDDGMSIGIVASEELVPFSDYNRYPKALAWLQEREPELALMLEGKSLLDFKILRGYSYPAKEILPARRIGVIGEAVGFADPFYSPGGDSIAVANSLVIEAIKRDEQSNLNDDTRLQVNDFFTAYLNGYTAAIQSIYPCLGSSRIASCHVMWDFCSLVWLSERLLEQRNLIEQIEHSNLKGFLDQFLVLTRDVDETCLDYLNRTTANGSSQIPSLELNRMVNYRNAFIAMMYNGEGLLKGFSERLKTHVASLFGSEPTRQWNPDQYLAVLEVIAGGMKAYLAELAAAEERSEQIGTVSGSQPTQGATVATATREPSRSLYPGLGEKLTNAVRWNLSKLGPKEHRERLAAQIALKWWKAGMQATVLQK